MESFIAEMKEFEQSIRENTSPPVTGIDGRIPVVMDGRVQLWFEALQPFSSAFPINNI